MTAIETRVKKFKSMPSKMPLLNLIGIDYKTMWYLNKGYTEEWIDRRLLCQDFYEKLLERWHVNLQASRFIESDCAMLTDEIIQAWSGKNTEEYKKFKGLDETDSVSTLMDNMSRLELHFTALGMSETLKCLGKSTALSFSQCHTHANRGGNEAGFARRKYENKNKKPVVTSRNFKRFLDEQHEPHRD